MKNIHLAAIAGFIVILHSSCLTSLHPLVTAETISADNRLVGNWVTDGETVQIKKITDSEPYNSLIKIQPVTRIAGEVRPQQKKEDSIMYANGYSVFFRKGDIEYFMFGAMTRIGNSQYIDLLPVIVNDPENQEMNGYEYSNDYLPTFTMAKLEMTGNNTLTLRFLNGDFIKEQLRQGNIRIKHEKDDLFDNFLVTASSSELRQFLTKYGNDERLFSKENSVTLTRKG